MRATCSLPATCDVAIVGGGIWGLSTAWHLTETNPGLRIVLLERANDVATETTQQAAGQIGQLRTDPLMIEAIGYSLDLYSQFAERTGFDTGFRRSGSLHLSLNSQRTAAFRSQIASAKRLGVEVQSIDAQEIAKLAPQLDMTTVDSTLFLPNDGYVDASLAARALGHAAARQGVQIHCGREVTDIATTTSGTTKLTTDQGELEAGQVVITSGPWTSRLAARVGITLPAQPIRLQQMRTAASNTIPAHHPVVRIPDHSCYLRPEAGGLLYGCFDSEALAYDLITGPDRRTYDVHSSMAVAEDMTQRLAALFPILNELPVTQRRQGLLTCTPDGRYVIGPMAGLPNVLFATGCGGMGISGSAAVGRWLAHWIAHGHPGADLSCFSPDRFGARGKDHSWIQNASRRIFLNYYALESPVYTLGAEPVVEPLSAANQ